jgi:hypothetical protein
MKVYEYVPKLPLRKKVIALCVGSGLGLFMTALNLISREFFEEWREMTILVFSIGSVLILSLVYLRKS